MTPLTLKNIWGPCPPDGYRYTFPEDGYVAHAWTYTDWVQIARLHALANNISQENIEAKMQNQLCQTLDPGWCDHDDPSRPRAHASLSWGDAARALEIFANWIKEGRPTVEQKEADRRALVCSRCYLNVHIEGCLGCQKLVSEVLVGKSSKYDFALRGCAVCKCVLRAKIHFPIDILDAETQKLQDIYPNFCWLKKDGENYRP